MEQISNGDNPFNCKLMVFLNPFFKLHINMHIPLTPLLIFLILLVQRIWLDIKTFHV